MKTFKLFCFILFVAVACESPIQDDEMRIDTAIALDNLETANCYIVSEAGDYKFKAVLGNSDATVGNVKSVEVLWESFGTDVAPNVGDLVTSVSYKNGYIRFSTPEDFKEGNAVIAAKDANGKILWSWHIWLTDEPEGQVYYNNAGIMMDRNLGATSATPGDVGALGLLYQWGRKDPFLGSSSISSNMLANSTITWPSSVYSNSSNGTIAYAIAHPTTFIAYNSYNDDWYYTGTNTTDNSRWSASSKDKTIYDPCPNGWRVPDYDLWSKILDLSSETPAFDSANADVIFVLPNNGNIILAAKQAAQQAASGLIDKLVGGSSKSEQADSTAAPSKAEKTKDAIKAIGSLLKKKSE